LNPALLVFLAAAATGVVSLLGAILLGKLVPSSRVTDKDAELTASKVETDKWRLAYEEQRRAAEKLEDVVQRQQIVTETVNQVLTALKSTAQTPLPPYQVGGST
jgi:hypothetical protein